VARKPPIIIVGPPRSGTKLISQVLGGHPGHFLVTEHKAKKVLPEDNSGIVDSELWWRNFQFKEWNAARNVPLIETPIHDKSAIQRVKGIYLQGAMGRRLVIKNPQHITRISFLKEMFPDAFFVFNIRAPWPTIRSATRKSTGKFFLRTEQSARLPNDHLMKVAYSWGEAVKIYNEEKDGNWTSVKYKDVVEKPDEIIENLFEFLDIDRVGYSRDARRKPFRKRRNFYPVKKKFRENKYKNEIVDVLRPGCEQFGYDIYPHSLPGNAVSYYFEGLARRGRQRVRGVFGL
jgi:hypothetical protein